MITDIHLQQFRSYKDESFEFSPTVNIIVGPNTSGKTNLLEALLVIAHGNSYRAKDAELIQFQKPWARIETHTQTGSRIVKLQHVEHRVNKLFTINNKDFTRLSFQKKLPIMLFEPNQLITQIGSPDARRNYIDDFLEQLTLEFGQLRKQYRRTLAQRNALVKRQLINKQELFAWDIRLSTLAGQIVRYRIELIKKINAQLSKTYQKVAQTKQKVTLEYQTKLNIDQYESDLVKKLERSIELDSLRGYTGYGPHRDNVVIKLNGQVVQHVASRGETRTLLLALKIIEATLIEDHLQMKPLLLLDDVFSELDSLRRQALTELLQTHQTFITTTDADVVIQHFTENAHIIPL